MTLEVGLCLDLILRSETGNEHSLDNLMKRVYAEYGASGKALNTAEVQNLAEAPTSPVPNSGYTLAHA